MKKTICKTLALIISLSMSILVLASCGSGSIEEAKTEINHQFPQIIDSFKSGNIDSINTYSINEVNIDDEDGLKTAILSSLSNIDYKINSVTPENGKNAVVNIDITMIDSSQVMEKYIQNIMTLVSSPEYQSLLSSLTKEDYAKMMDDELAKILASGELQTVTKTVDVNLQKSNDTWKLKDNSLADLLMNNTVNAINQIKQ